MREKKDKNKEDIKNEKKEIRMMCGDLVQRYVSPNSSVVECKFGSRDDMQLRLIHNQGKDYAERTDHVRVSEIAKLENL